MQEGLNQLWDGHVAKLEKGGIMILCQNREPAMIANLDFLTIIYLQACSLILVLILYFHLTTNSQLVFTASPMTSVGKQNPSSFFMIIEIIMFA